MAYPEERLDPPTLELPCAKVIRAFQRRPIACEPLQKHQPSMVTRLAALQTSGRSGTSPRANPLTFWV